MNDRVKPETIKWLIGTAFAAFVFGAGFYGIVLYEYALDDLTKGALISLMTLAAQFVFGEALASAVGRRAQASFDAGSAASSGPTVTAAGADTVTVEPFTEPEPPKPPRG